MLSSVSFDLPQSSPSSLYHSSIISFFVFWHVHVRSKEKAIPVLLPYLNALRKFCNLENPSQQDGFPAKLLCAVQAAILKAYKQYFDGDVEGNVLEEYSNVLDDEGIFLFLSLSVSLSIIQLCCQKNNTSHDKQQDCLKTCLAPRLKRQIKDHI
jgi:hypothetical protein